MTNFIVNIPKDSLAWSHYIYNILISWWRFICNFINFQAEELKEKQEKQKLLKKAFQERGVPYYSIDEGDDAF